MDLATMWRDDMLSELSNFSDELMELALAEAPDPCGP